ncbi:hypothetical protein ACFVKB_46205 [Rhodococcus sp. NPDC127530]|uniref:hypothetical protein n=1 Tax=unclassified Rhodococcus (in: high G+C Gram-positive bacteria) TaxID=192944 RepID=UPI003637F130
MSSLLVRATMPILPGKAQAAKEAARALKERSDREDKGMLVYQFFVDASEENIIAFEGYKDLTSCLAHIDASDFGPLFNAVDARRMALQIHGDADDAAAAFAAIGEFELYSPAL